MAVDQVTGALVYSSPREQNMSESSSEDLRSAKKADDDMILSHFQKDAKIKALA